MLARRQNRGDEHGGAEGYRRRPQIGAGRRVEEVDGAGRREAARSAGHGRDQGDHAHGRRHSAGCSSPCWSAWAADEAVSIVKTASCRRLEMGGEDVTHAVVIRTVTRSAGEADESDRAAIRAEPTLMETPVPLSVPAPLC